MTLNEWFDEKLAPYPTSLTRIQEFERTFGNGALSEHVYQWILSAYDAGYRTGVTNEKKRYENS